LALLTITTFPFYLLALLKARGSIGPIFSFFFRELATRSSSKDIDLLNLESSLYALGTLLLNRNKLRSILAFKPLTSLKSNSKSARVINSSIDSSLILIVEASTKSLWP
jgi:hypothetical protein